MSDTDTARNRLLELLKRDSVFHGDFTLASGAKSNIYVDCRITTMNPEAATLLGQVRLGPERGPVAKPREL